MSSTENINTLLLLQASAAISLLFAGQTFYTSFIDHSVINTLVSPRMKITHWAVLYHEYFKIMTSLSLFGIAAGVIAYQQTNEKFWLYGVGSLLLMFPHTKLAMEPISSYLQ
jgi:hypothetical protein